MCGKKTTQIVDYVFRNQGLIEYFTPLINYVLTFFDFVHLCCYFTN